LYAFVAESIAPVVIVYNRDYDLGVINRLNARYGLPEFGKHERWDCALRAFSDFKGDPGKFPGSYKWHKLDDAAAHFGIPPGGHRALADAETARKVVLAMAAAGEAPTDPQDDLKEARRHLARRRGLLS
jgi:DNA polymerase-3 subunit epsilon